MQTRTRKHNTGWIETSFSQNMMDKIAMQPAIPICKGMNIYKTKSKNGGRYYRIELAPKIDDQIQSCPTQGWVNLQGVR